MIATLRMATDGRQRAAAHRERGDNPPDARPISTQEGRSVSAAPLLNRELFTLSGTGGEDLFAGAVFPANLATPCHAPKSLRTLSRRASTERPWGGRSAGRRRRVAAPRRRGQSRL